MSLITENEQGHKPYQVLLCPLLLRWGSPQTFEVPIHKHILFPFPFLSLSQPPTLRITMMITSVAIVVERITTLQSNELDIWLSIQISFRL